MIELAGALKASADAFHNVTMMDAPVASAITMLRLTPCLLALALVYGTTSSTCCTTPRTSTAWLPRPHTNGRLAPHAYEPADSDIGPLAPPPALAEFLTLHRQRRALVALWGVSTPRAAHRDLFGAGVLGRSPRPGAAGDALESAHLLVADMRLGPQQRAGMREMRRTYLSRVRTARAARHAALPRVREALLAHGVLSREQYAR